MRYRFAGLKRDTGQPLRGHVEADTDNDAYHVLGDHGIVVESLTPIPERRDDSRQPAVAHAIDHALDASAVQVPFDALATRYVGKRVWVLDREKIKNRVMQTIDEVVRSSRARAMGDPATRNQISKALEQLFGDNRNLTSPAPSTGGGVDTQLDRLAIVVQRLERSVATIQEAMRNGAASAAAAPAPRVVVQRRQRSPACDAVLKSIFEANLELRRELNGVGGS